MKKATLLTLVIIFCFLHPAPGAGKLLAFPTEERFTLHLPEGWKPIPREVLDDYSDAMARLAPAAGRQTFDYGFQLAASKKWFDYPYILVQVNRSGRVPEEQLESMARIGRAMGEGFDRTRQSLSPVVDRARLGETTYDPSANIIWTRISLNVKGFGPVSALIGSILTGDGFIQISCNARERDFAAYLPQFEEIVRNTELDPVIRYRPAGGEGIGWAAVMVAVLLLGGGAFIVYRLRRR